MSLSSWLGAVLGMGRSPQATHASGFIDEVEDVQSRSLRAADRGVVPANLIGCDRNTYLSTELEAKQRRSSFRGAIGRMRQPRRTANML
ncbi:hypothetical protein VZG28_02755 [Synechococcus elongatus IITB4]|uniref:hypothetical protein n=1 Tax=Synechococcus elongatus TaxID=32046 RepID=UPI0030CAA697